MSPHPSRRRLFSPVIRFRLFCSPRSLAPNWHLSTQLEAEGYWRALPSIIDNRQSRGNILCSPLDAVLRLTRFRRPYRLPRATLNTAIVIHIRRPRCTITLCASAGRDLQATTNNERAQNTTSSSLSILTSRLRHPLLTANTWASLDAITFYIKQNVNKI